MTDDPFKTVNSSPQEWDPGVYVVCVGLDGQVNVRMAQSTSFDKPLRFWTDNCDPELQEYFRLQSQMYDPQLKGEPDDGSSR